MYATELIVVRHGETTWNVGGILQGQEASSLSDVGKDQACAVAERLATTQADIASIYSSDLERALDTANLIANKCNIPQARFLVQICCPWINLKLASND
ncbi:hypothetical protein L7F22_061412 [Adiantum nelumboides]|nr:hypothetical protein [Adiantum nelumboides]